jgi:PAS domain S-box-containing protein
MTDHNTPVPVPDRSSGTDRENEQSRLLEILLSQFFDVILSLDGDWRIRGGRGKFEDLFKQPLEQVRGQEFWEAFPHLREGELADKLRDVRESGQAARINGQLLPDQGWMEVLATPAADGLELVIRDLSEYQQGRRGPAEAERALILFNSLLDSIPEGIMIADATDVCVLVISRHGEEHLGLPREEILHRPFREIYEKVTFLETDGETPMPYEEHPLIRALERGDSAEDEDKSLRKATGEMLFISSKYGPVRNENGEIVAGIYSWMDITRRKQMEIQLEETTKRLADSNQALEAFASSAAHDLQEPLRKIAGFGNMLEKEHQDALGESGRDLLRRMRSASTRMQRMINSLLNFSRISARPLQKADVDLNTVLRGVITDLELPLRRSGGRVDLGDLPTLQADPTLVEHIFLNLVGNSLKFHRKGVPPVVRVTHEGIVTDGKKFVRIRVSDNGIGFDPRNLDRIFQPFQRLHGRNEYEGSGLGLAIVHKIVEVHGGSISADSTPGEGSTFWVDLPVEGVG